MWLVMFISCVVIAAVLWQPAIQAQQVEEFHAHGPMEFHDLAMNAFLEMRKVNPKENLSHDSPFLQRAAQHAVKRLTKKPDEAFELRVRDLYIVSMGAKFNLKVNVSSCTQYLNSTIDLENGSHWWWR